MHNELPKEYVVAKRHLRRALKRTAKTAGMAKAMTRALKSKM